MVEIPTICRYCGGAVHLVPAAKVYGPAAAKRLGLEREKFYQCQNCNARVGCHKGSTRPLGNLANEALRMKRMETHQVFDSFWKERGMSRTQGYNLVLDDAVDVQGCCRKAEELFELYQRCANRKQIETICVNFLRGMEATKLSVTGHMYFVPRTFMERVDIFEDFITLLSGLNKKQTPLVVNSFYIIDDAKQRDKMTEEFYLAVKKEIAAYQEKCDYLIKSSSQSPAVMERWVLKVQALEEKKRHYEGVLQRELDGLDDEFSFLKLLSQELQVRAKSIRSQRFQQRAA